MSFEVGEDSAAIRAATARQRGIEWGQRAIVASADDARRQALARELTRRGMEITSVRSAASALEALDRFNPPVIVIEVDLGVSDGLELLRQVRRDHPRVACVLSVSTAAFDDVMRITREPAAAHLVLGPHDDGALTLKVREALEQRQLVEENAWLTHEVTRLDNLTVELHHDVRAAVARRQGQMVAGKRLLESSLDALHTPIAVVDPFGLVRLVNLSWAQEAASEPASSVGRRCYEELMGRSSPCPGCPVADAAHQAAPGDEPRPLRRHVEAIDVEVPARQAGRVWGAALYPITFPQGPADAELPAELGATAGVVDARPTPAAWGWVCQYRDISAERSAQAQAYKTERMVAVGELAAGVAHELNNPLGGILALAQVLQRDAQLEPDDREIIDDIEEACVRCKKIIEALLLFARGPAGDSEEHIDVERCLQQALAVSQGPLKEALAAVELVVEPSLPSVRGSAALLQQAVVALVRNAAEALVKSNRNSQMGGTITVRALAQRDAVWIEVADDGPGLSDQLAEAAFTPLVTGRDSAEGAGLGLALVYRIVERLRGRVEHFSGVEGGATFRVELPAAEVSGPTPVTEGSSA